MSVDVKPLVSLIVAAYNESAIVKNNMEILCDYMVSLEGEYRWELIIVDDGSTDGTGQIIETLAQERRHIKVLHHSSNEGLGKALQDGFAITKGDFVVTCDVDLSCTPDHIERLLKKIQGGHAQIVIATPHMKGGKMTNVPLHRSVLSCGANFFLSVFFSEKISDLTSMMRVYRGPFIRSLSLRSSGMAIMPEIIYKASIMHAKIVQIPAHLDWTEQRKPHVFRRSNMKVFKHTIATLLMGFLLRPFLFFILPGFFVLLFSLYPITWLLIHFFREFSQLTEGSLLDRACDGLAQAYQLHPHTYLTAFFSLLLAIQLIALGLQSLQSKHYFEELFSLATKMFSNSQKEVSLLSDDEPRPEGQGVSWKGFRTLSNLPELNYPAQKDGASSNLDERQDPSKKHTT